MNIATPYITISYNIFRKLILVAFCFFFYITPTLAQTKAQMMRFLMVKACLQYGQKLYDRGDFNEASAVFNHVLSIDSHQPQALKYLKDMGEEPAAATFTPIALPDVLDQQSLKEAIKAKQRDIAKLKMEINQIRAGLDASSLY